MPESKKETWIIITICLLFAILYGLSLPSVPFHPDESTHIYMSRDLAILFSDPLSLSYQPDDYLSPEMRYRAIDTPLTRYTIGLSRLITGAPELSSDWDWSQDWGQNLSAGAYPGSSNILVRSRISSILFVPLGIFLFYLALRKIASTPVAIAAVLLLGLNPLILLHGRRAMAEPVLFLGVCFFLWAVTREKINPLMIGLSLAISINAKQSGIFLLPVGIIAVAINQTGVNRLRKMLTRIVIVAVVILGITFLLNPYFWITPFQALVTGINLRGDLVQAQINDYLGGNRLNIFQRIFALIDNLYLSSPQYAEIDKYSPYIADQVENYQQCIAHTWGRGLLPASLQISLIISGIFMLIKRYTKYQEAVQKSLGILIAGSILVLGGTLFAFQIPWQRYVIPLVPFNIIWISLGITPLIEYLESLYYRVVSKE